MFWIINYCNCIGSGTLSNFLPFWYPERGRRAAQTGHHLFTLMPSGENDAEKKIGVREEKECWETDRDFPDSPA